MIHNSTTRKAMQERYGRALRSVLCNLNASGSSKSVRPHFALYYEEQRATKTRQHPLQTGSPLSTIYPMSLRRSKGISKDLKFWACNRMYRRSPESTITTKFYDLRRRHPDGLKPGEEIRYGKLSEFGAGGQGAVDEVINLYNGEHYARKEAKFKAMPKWRIDNEVVSKPGLGQKCIW